MDVGLAGDRAQAARARALADTFVAKAVLNLATTRGIIERLLMDRALKRLCGFPMWKAIPDEATFSRAFAQFTKGRLPERVHEAPVKTYLGEQLIGHISRDGTAIEAREKAEKKVAADAPVKDEGAKARRGRPRKDEAPPAKQNKDMPAALAEAAGDAGGVAQGLRPRHEMQLPGLQEFLDRLQTAYRHRRLRRAGERAADQRLGARQPDGGAAGDDDGGVRDKPVRPDGRRLLQRGIAGTQP